MANTLNEDRIAEMTGDELEGEIEAAVEIRDKAEEHGDTIRYVTQSQHIKELQQEREARNILADYFVDGGDT